MKKLFDKTLMRRISVIFLTFAVIFSVGLEVANANASLINNALNTVSYRIVDNSGDETDTNYFPSSFSSSEEVAAYGRAVCQEAEAEGLVLLKNENAALPLEKGSSISLVLQTSVEIHYGSTGSGKIDPAKYDSFRTVLEKEGFTVNAALWDFYLTDSAANSPAYESAMVYDRRAKAMVYKVNALPWDLYSDAAKASIGETGGSAVVVVGRLSGEGNDVSAAGSDGYDGSYLTLSDAEITVLKELTALKHAGKIENIVVLLNTALAFQTGFLMGDVDGVEVDACMWIGNPGITGLYAVADVLSGDVTPSGKLSDTYVRDNFSSPAMASWILNPTHTFSSSYQDAAELGLNSTQQYYGVYVEDIYVGYRYYETRYEDKVLNQGNAGAYDYGRMVAYPFGYGLSYTTFSYSDYSVRENEDGGYDVSVKVTNTGSTYSGKEAVQVYLQKPYTQYDREHGVEKASVELAGFAKTGLLSPGASETVSLTVGKEQLKTFDAYGYETYILEEGDYYLACGTSAHDALNNILAAKGKTVSDGMDDAGNASLAALIGQDIRLDTKTYAVSSETGNAVTGRLDFIDMNEYAGRGENRVTYVSRNDWTGTWPESAVVFKAGDPVMLADLGSNKEITEDPALSMPEFGAENGLTAVMLRSSDEDPIPYNDPRWDLLLNEMSYGDISLLVTNAVYGTSGIPSIGLPATVDQDGPTGVVSSKENLSFPSEGIWASSFNKELIAKVGDAIAEDARDCGCQGMYLPGINIHRAPFGGRTHEYFSEDPYLSGIAVQEEVKALQKKGVTPYVKHFVFNDEEDNRNGVSVWLNEQSAREIYLKPFEYAVAPSKGGSTAVMSSFNRAGCIWVSASSVLIQDILRGEFGFLGVVLTDMASGNGALYMTFKDAFMNGTDMFLGNGSETLLDEFRDSTAFVSMVRESAHRVAYVLANTSCAMNGISASGEIVPVTPWWKVLLSTLKYGFLGLGLLAAVLMAVSYFRKAEA